MERDSPKTVWSYIEIDRHKMTGREKGKKKTYFDFSLLDSLASVEEKEAKTVNFRVQIYSLE